MIPYKIELANFVRFYRGLRELCQLNATLLQTDNTISISPKTPDPMVFIDFMYFGTNLSTMSSGIYTVLAQYLVCKSNFFSTAIDTLGWLFQRFVFPVPERLFD